MKQEQVLTRSRVGCGLILVPTLEPLAFVPLHILDKSKDAPTVWMEGVLALRATAQSMQVRIRVMMRALHTWVSSRLFSQHRTIGSVTHEVETRHMRMVERYSHEDGGEACRPISDEDGINEDGGKEGWMMKDRMLSSVRKNSSSDRNG